MNKKEELYKNRNAAACIGAAYNLFFGNLKTICHRLGLPVLAISIALTACLLAYTPNKAINEWGLSHPALTFSLMATAVVVAIAALFWLQASTYTLLNGHRLKANLRRCLGAFACYLLYYLLLAVCQYLCLKVVTTQLANRFADQATTVYVIGSLLFLFLSAVIYIVWLPFMYSTTRYICNHKASLRDLFVSDYLRGWKHIGRIFLTVLLTCIILTLIVFVVCAPLAIIFSAQAQNQLGMLDNDPSGAPAYLLALVIATSVVTLMLIAFVTVWYLFILYFLYGSIAEAEQLEPAEDTPRQ